MNNKNTENYEIGYGKPPRETRFTKGHSGNLKGRPKGAKNLETIVNKVGKRRVKVTGKHGTRSMRVLEAMVYQLSVPGPLWGHKGDPRVFAITSASG